MTEKVQNIKFAKKIENIVKMSNITDTTRNVVSFKQIFFFNKLEIFKPV